jgi:hypothetical protein
VYIDVPSGVVQNWNVHDNALYVNNAKNVSVRSIGGFDSFRFDLPNDIHNNDTILTINDQDEDDSVYSRW